MLYASSPMEKKESYRHTLPHFQKQGQAYFVTWSLKDAIPHKVVYKAARKLNLLRLQIKTLEQLPSEFMALARAKKEYFQYRKKYIQAYAEILDNCKSPAINLSDPEIVEILVSTLQFWHGRKINNFAFTVMPNHVHWVFELYPRNQDGNPLYLQDLMQSVKRFSSNRINKVLGRTGPLWQKESFDTTIRNYRHLQCAIRYTLNNPVKAGLVGNWTDWPGTWGGCRGF